MSAQLANAPVAKVLSRCSDSGTKLPEKGVLGRNKLPVLKADLPEGQYIMGNYKSDAVASSEDGLGLFYFAGAVIPTGTTINTTGHKGNIIRAIRVGLANPATISRIFAIPVDADGNFLEGGLNISCTVEGVSGWNVIELPEAYTINDGYLFIGFDYLQESRAYPISCVLEGTIQTTYCYLYDETEGLDGWYDVGVNSYGNLSVQAIVEGEDPEPPLTYEPAVPANPTITEWLDCGDETGNSYLGFNIPTTDIDGLPMNTNQLYYYIYVDGEVFTFAPDTYPLISEEMTLIPYNFTDQFDFRNYRVYFYRTNADGFEKLFTGCIGIQSVYIIDDVENRSDIVYYYLNHMALPDDGVTNTETISTNNGNIHCVTLEGRTLYKDGNWNTLCLPFALTAEEISNGPLAGADIRTLSSGTVTGHHVDLAFESVTAIEAGKPYIVKWESGKDIVSPTFINVTIDKTDNSITSADGNVNFIGYYDAFNITPNDNPLVYYLDANNKLRYTTKERTLNACRAYFTFKSPEASANNFTFNIDFGDTLDGINTLQRENETKSNAWYTIDGRKLTGKPVQKGVYVTNGQKIVIK